MNNLTLLIPANREAESLPLFLKELEIYSYEKIIVLQEEDKETIDSISNFKDVKICVQSKKGYGNALIEGFNAIKTKYFCIINADGSMDPKYLNEMLNFSQQNDLVFQFFYSFSSIFFALISGDFM